MARVTFKNPVTAFRGKLGGIIFRQRNDDTSMNNMATDSHAKRNPTNAHTNYSRNFRTPSGEETTGLHPVYEELARATNKSAYNIALSDRMMPPVIHRILLRGNNILIQASDNVMVARVEVTILDEQGGILEEGEAVRLKADWWEYIPSYAGAKIIAAAWDLAGNVTKAEM